MRLLVIGASGLVGSALYKEAVKQDYSVLGTYLGFPKEGLQKLDYGDKNEVSKLLDSFLPQVIICSAGKTNVDWIEQNPQEAWKINVARLNILFQIASQREIPVAFFSTDYIFDGKNGPYSEDDLPNPINVYGYHKLATEIMLKTYLPKNHFIFRTSYVFGQESQEKNYVYTVVKNLSLGKEIKTPEDMLITPTYTSDIARFSLNIIENNRVGIINLSGSEYLTRFEFARNIATIFNLKESLIVPIKFSSLNAKANRPLKSGLKNEKACKLSNLSWTPFKEALKETREAMERANQYPIDTKSATLSYKTKLQEQIRDSTSRICIFIPCYNATVTLPKVLERIPASIKDKVEEIFIVDNDSKDYTYLMAVGYRQSANISNLKILKNIRNFGYGGSQKLAYAHAIKQGYDMVVMLHGDAQYAPEKLPVMIETMEKDKSIDLLFGSRMLGDPLKGGMPLHRFLGNKTLTLIQNLFLGTNISEFHSGYRIFRTKALKEVPFHLCSNDYHFDTEIIILFTKNKFKISEVSIDTHYGDEKCYVNIWKYGLRVLLATFCYYLHTKGLRKYELYKDRIKADIDRILKELKTEIH